MKIKIFMTVMLSALWFGSWAQDEQAAISDDDLNRYAVMMDSVDEMRISLLAEISDMVKNNEKISVARYNDLFKIIDDESKLTEEKATPEEIAAVQAVQDRKDTGTTEINEAFKSLAKEYVGASTYNKVKKALDEDTTLKSKYKTMLDELKADNGG